MTNDKSAEPAPGEPEERAEEASSGPASLSAMAELGRLAAGLAHEIKNPLSTMSINLALLEEELGKAALARDPERSEPSARERRYLKRIESLKREVDHLRTIVEDFLRYARGGEINRAPGDLVALVREVLDFVDPEDELAGIRHHVDLPVGLPLVMLDPAAMRQALLNLVVNARQAMPMGGELIVRVARRGNWAELSVTDTGVGMSPEDRERCFEVYFSNKKGGTGLGLSTARRVVDEHEGRITVVSELGRGTSFTILLPLVVEIHRAGAREEGEERSAASHGAEAE